MTGKSAPPRPHYPVWVVARASRPSDGNKQHTGGTPVAPIRVGVVTSGTQSPSLGIGIGMGYVPPELVKPGTQIEIEIRGKRFAAIVVPEPIYRKT